MSATKQAYHDEICAQSADYFELMNTPDPEFARFQRASDCGLRSAVLDLLGIGWTEEQVMAMVRDVANVAKAA